MVRGKRFEVSRRVLAAVADAHLGAVILSASADKITVVTSDPATCDWWPETQT
jgi:hypothetical protein